MQMQIDQLSELAALLLAVSLATERGVVVLKTIAPRHLALERTPRKDDQLVEEADRWRRLGILGIAYLIAYAVGLLLADQRTAFVFGSVKYGAAGESLPVWLLALLASGGSALWTNVVGLTSVLKDLKRGERAATRTTELSVDDPNAANLLRHAVIPREPTLPTLDR